MAAPHKPTPPTVVALVTQKGGSGKTTLAANLAVAATEAGETVVMIDLDPQASLIAWEKDRKPENIVVHGGDFSANFEQVIDGLGDMELDGKDITLVIIDCPGINSTLINKAMKRADFCLLPARPALMDIRASRPTVQALMGLGRPFAFVLNQCTPGRLTSRTNEGREALKMMGGLAEPMIGLRSDYQDAMQNGLGVTEYAPESKAAEEMRQLWQWVSSRLARPTHQQEKQADGAQEKINGGSTGRGFTFGYYPPSKAR